MDNQHRQIKGYRELDASEIQIINEVKGVGSELDMLVLKVQAMPNVDPRWAAIGKTHLQEGLMALVRSVAKPESF